MTASQANFGPLTTTFTPPPECFNEKWVQYNTKLTVLRWGAACGADTYAFDSSCYPSGWQDVSTGRPNYKGFSPGLMCPSGWTSAIDASMIGQTKSFWLSRYVTSLGRHEVATACCPSGYGFDGQWCSRNSLTFSGRPYISTSNNTCATTPVPFYNGQIGKGRRGDATFEARPVVLIRDTRSSYNIPTSTGTASEQEPPEGLSTGAKIAIGVCIPIGVILMAAVLFVWLHRRKHARVSEDVSAAVARPTRGDPFTGKPELETNVPVHSHRSELDVAIPPKEPAELPARDATLVELPAHIPQAELPGDNVKGGAQKDSHGSEPDEWPPR